MNWRSLLEKIRVGFLAKNWVWILAIALSGFLAFYWDATSSERKSAPEAESPEAAATLIPAGFVLVPIEVANFESLDSILGKFGTVDLFLPAEEGKFKAHKVADHVRILRAPLNPSHFAVLVPEADTAALVTHNGPFVVVVQNSHITGTGRAYLPEEGDGSSTRPTKKSRASRITVEVSGGFEK